MPPTPQQLAAAYWVVQVELYCPSLSDAQTIVTGIESDRGGLNTKATRVAASVHDADLTDVPSDRIVLADWAFADQAGADTLFSRIQSRWNAGHSRNRILGLTQLGTQIPVGSSVARHLCFDGQYDPATPVAPYPCGTAEYPVERVYKP